MFQVGANISEAEEEAEQKRSINRAVLTKKEEKPCYVILIII